jgi:phosphatidylserine/phosphatidylglycerophosphate/cardiolipin synthase-like enzyme
VEPEDREEPILARLQSARQEVFVTVYLLSDPEIISALKEADRRGVEVRVMLEEKPFGGGGVNSQSKPELEEGGVAVRFTRPVFALTHQKTVIFDGREVCILNLNLTRAAFEKNREYGVCSQNKEEAREARAIFLADWERKDYQPTAPNLVVSPDNSRGKLTGLLRSAKATLDMEMEVIEDEQIIGLLAEKVKTASVRLLLADFKKIPANRAPAEKLRAAGVEVRTISSPYMHAKLILADGQKAYVGSVNFTAQSLDRNRELGIIVSQSDIISRLGNTFVQDWGAGTELQ